MRPKTIRVVAICVVRDGDRIFVSENLDRVKRETFYRPLGGGVEYGERGVDAITRELREEICAEVDNLRLLGTVENIFTLNGAIGHEIVFVYQGRFSDQSFYQRERIDGFDGAEGTEPLVAVWKPLHFFLQGCAPLYPDGLLELLIGKPHVAILRGVFPRVDDKGATT